MSQTNLLLYFSKYTRKLSGKKTSIFKGGLLRLPFSPPTSRLLQPIKKAKDL